MLLSVFSLVFQHSNDLHFHVAACVLKYANSRCVAHVPVFNLQLKKGLHKILQSDIKKSNSEVDLSRPSAQVAPDSKNTCWKQC